MEHASAMSSTYTRIVKKKRDKATTIYTSKPFSPAH